MSAPETEKDIAANDSIPLFLSKNGVLQVAGPEEGPLKETNGSVMKYGMRKMVKIEHGEHGET
jgi:hypothetical protein